MRLPVNNREAPHAGKRTCRPPGRRAAGADQPLVRSAAAGVSAFCDPPDPFDEFCGLESFLDEHGFDAGVQARVVLRVEVAP